MERLIMRKQPRATVRVVGKLPRGVRRRVFHRALLGYWPNLRTPSTYAEVASRELLRGSNVLASVAGDKAASKVYARGAAPELKAPHTRWLGLDPSTIPDHALEGAWVAKLNAGSGAAVAGVGVEDRPGLEEFVRSWAKDASPQIFCSDYYATARDGIIIEDYLGDSSVRPFELHFLCFEGRAELTLVYQFDSEGVREEVFLGRDGTMLEVSQRGVPTTARVLGVPNQFHRARDVAEKLAKEFAHVRVDLYVIGNELWFGELTPFPAGGLVAFQPDSYDRHLASLWLDALH